MADILDKLFPQGGENPRELQTKIDSFLYESVKERLVFRLTRANQDILSNVPHRILAGDIAVTYHILLDIDVELVKSVAITNELGNDVYHVDEETLFKDTMVSSRKVLPVEINRLDEMIGIGHMDGPEILVLTNNLGMDGAAVVLYPGVLDEVYLRLSGPFYILPSSVHEVLAVGKTPDGPGPEEFEEMVRSVNENIVSENPEDLLSDLVYYYDGKTFSICNTERTVA